MRELSDQKWSFGWKESELSESLFGIVPNHSLVHLKHDIHTFCAFMCARARTCLYAHALSSLGSSLDDGPVVLFMWLSRALCPSISHSFILALFLRLSLTPSISLCLSTLCPFYPFTRPTTRLSLNPRTYSIYFALYHFIQWILYFRRDDDAYICVFEPASRPSGPASGKCFILF